MAGSLHPSLPPAHPQAVSCVWEKGPVPWTGDPHGGKRKSQSPLTPPFPSPPAQGKLSSSSSAISLANSKSCCSRSRRSWGNRWGEGWASKDQLDSHCELRPARSTPRPQLHSCPSPSRNAPSSLSVGKFYLPVVPAAADSLPLQIPSPCCMIWEETSLPEAK